MKVSFLMTKKPHWDQEITQILFHTETYMCCMLQLYAVQSKACDRNAEANYRINKIWQVIYGDMRSWDFGILENSSKKKYCNQRFKSMEERK